MNFIKPDTQIDNPKNCDDRVSNNEMGNRPYPTIIGYLFRIKVLIQAKN